MYHMLEINDCRRWPMMLTKFPAACRLKWLTNVFWLLVRTFSIFFQSVRAGRTFPGWAGSFLIMMNRKRKKSLSCNLWVAAMVMVHAFSFFRMNAVINWGHVMCCAGFIETRAECRRRCSPASQHSLQSRVWGLLKGQARINVQKLLMLMLMLMCV